MPFDLIQFRQTGVYTAQVPIPSALADLAQIQEELNHILSFRTKLKWASLVCLFTVILIPVAIALFIYSLFHRQKLTQHPARRQTLADVLQMLRHDTADNKPVSLRLGIASHDQKRSEQPLPNRRNGKQQLFSDDWLSISGTLMDGTHFNQTITDFTRRRTYRNPRGKYKTKNRVRQRIILKLSYPAEIYGNPDVVRQQLRNAFRLPPSTVLKGIKVTDQAIIIKAVVAQETELKSAIAVVFLGAYRILNLSRKILATRGAK